MCAVLVSVLVSGPTTRCRMAMFRNSVNTRSSDACCACGSERVRLW